MRFWILVISFFVYSVVLPVYLVYGILNEPKALNVWVDYGPHARTWSKYVFTTKYRSLYRFSHRTLKFVPDLAEDLPKIHHEYGFVIYDVKLRKGLRWSDGTPLTSEDVVFTLNSVKDLVENHGLSGNWNVMVDPEFFSHAEALNDREVRLFFKKVGVLRVEYGVLMAPIIQKRYWERYVEEVLRGSKDVDFLYNVDTVSNPDPASGPFILKKWEKGAFIRLDAVKDYFDRGYKEVQYENGAVIITHPSGYKWKSEEPKGRAVLEVEMGPFVDGVIYRIFSDRSSAVQALVLGDLDMILNPSGLQMGEVRILKETPGAKLIRSPSMNPRYLGFNLDESPTRYKAFRKAIAYILDMNFLAKRVLNNAILPIDSLIPPTNPYWYNPSVEIVDESLRTVDRWKKAVYILKRAGFKWIVEPLFKGNELVREGRGLISPNGEYVKELKLLAPNESYDPLRSIVAVYLETWARKLGIPVKAYLMDFKAIVQKVWYERDFSMYILGWGQVLTPEHLISYFKSDSVFNSSHYANPKYDELCEKLLESDLKTARKVAFEMQKILAEDIPFLPLFVPILWEAYRDNLMFPYTEVEGGLQAVQGLPAYVKKEMR